MNYIPQIISNKHTVADAKLLVSVVLDLGLSENIVYHNLEHTQQVVNAANKICDALAVDDQEREIVLVAAWFHDVGHVKTYLDHEIVSQQVARYFLQEKQWYKTRIEQVVNCIKATGMPQQPSNRLEAIVCDADLYHLSTPDYENSAQLLRKEWELVLEKHWTDDAWRLYNLQFLQTHDYWTSFGKTVLQKGKEVNITRMG